MVGVDVKNKNIFHVKFICSECGLIMVQPIKLKCGHYICQSCQKEQNEQIQCPDCLKMTPKNELCPDQTLQNEIEALSIECSICGKPKSFNEYHDHPNPRCQHCDQKFDSIESLDKHKVSQCQKLTFDCLLKSFGCNEKIVRCNILEHYSNEQHQRALLEAFNRLPLRELCQTFRSLLKDLAMISNDTEQKFNQMLRQCQMKYPTLTLDFLQTPLSVEESSGSRDRRVTETIDNSPCVSCDSLYIWKIDNVREMMSDAEWTQQNYIMSPPFYTSEPGYKMRACLYPNGDGNARGTHMSLFIALIKAEYDEVLRFPFHYKVTFCLHDRTQTNQYIKSFRPDMQSSSFQQPRSEMNVASGILDFCPIEMIKQEGSPYVKDDTMFIEIMIDFDNIPTTLLPYAFRLNPGLPRHIRLRRIRDEEEQQS